MASDNEDGNSVKSQSMDDVFAKRPLLVDSNDEDGKDNEIENGSTNHHSRKRLRVSSSSEESDNERRHFSKSKK